MFVVVMGVSGSGKSTVGAALAGQLGVVFVDADDLHPRANVEKMAAGQALTDADRWPWLERVGTRGRALDDTTGGVVIACSALRRSYREVLRTHGATHFVHLVGDRDLLARRMDHRAGHFMSPGMLDSQLSTLEPTTDEPDVLDVDVAQPPPAVVDEALTWVRRDEPHRPQETP